MDELKNQIKNILVKINQDSVAVKYCVYRTALKLCELQEIFHLLEVSSLSIFNAIKNHCEGSDSLLHSISTEVVSFKQLNKIVHNIFQSSGVEIILESNKVAQLVSTLIFETFHNVQETNVSLLAVVLFFVAMGNDSLQLKYKQVFDLYAAPLGMLTRSRTGLLLTHLMRLTDIVGESASFGKINASVLSCFEGVLGNMIAQQHFLRWMLREPQSTVWLPTMHRINLAKSSVHDVECASCKVQPIVGLRFQCLKCLDYNSCQVCFLTQHNVSRSHKLHHPRQEYCLPAGSKEKLNAFARTIRNIVTKRYKHKTSTPSYLPINQQLYDEEPQQSTCDNNAVEENTSFGDLSHLAEEERKKLEKVVLKLKSENKKISGTVHLLESSKNEDEDRDDDATLLQNRLDTVMLHNQSLRAELDNLKCVVFAESFLSPSPVVGLLSDHLVDESAASFSDHGEVEVANIEASSLKPQKRNPKKEQRKADQSWMSLEDSTFTPPPEEQLRLLVDKLQTALLNNAARIPASHPILDEVYQVACETRLVMNDVIDQAVLIQ